MNWNQEFEYHLLLRLTTHHNVISVTREGASLLAAARRLKDERELFRQPAEKAAHFAIDQVIHQST
jgi:hypothetical protein